MDKSRYMPRIIDEQLARYLKTFGAVCIEGPKWCGKTWTSSFHSSSEIYIGDPAGGFQNRRLAEISPDLVLDGEFPRLIDEWQEVPQIWDAVRSKVDQTGRKGQYILTGSSTPNYKGVLHSGAGRIGRLRMRPMSLYESGDSVGLISFKELCYGKISSASGDIFHGKFIGDTPLMKLIELIIRGGWPESLSLQIDQSRIIASEYLNAIIENDVHRLDGVKRNVNKMRLLLRSLARNEGSLVSNRTLKNDIKEVDDEDVDSETVAEYLNIFDRLYITDNLPPYSSGIRSSVRVRQSVKRFFADPSLTCALLRATPAGLINDLNTLGFLFEALCVRDLRIYAEAFGGSVFHYRDYRGREIDLVIERPDGHWCAFEVKLGANQIDEAAAKLVSLRDEIVSDSAGKKPEVLVIVCGLANAAYQRPDGVFVVPIRALSA